MAEKKRISSKDSSISRRARENDVKKYMANQARNLVLKKIETTQRSDFDDSIQIQSVGDTTMLTNNEFRHLL